MEIPTVISTFAGCGGSSLGYKLAGYKELLAIDFDDNSVETFKLNFPEVPVWKRDIKTVTANEILSFCNIKIRELDVLDGSPPCQGFSTAGKRKVTDLRNSLFQEFVKLINGLQPKVFIMENVSGMAKGKMKGCFIEIMNALKSTGYSVKCKLLNSANYNVPQVRQRLFFIGIRPDLNKEPKFPKPNNKIITVEDTLKTVNYSCDLDNTDIAKWNMAPLCYIKRLKPGENLSKYYGSYFSYQMLDLKKPCPTIEKSITFAKVSGKFLNKNGKICCMTINECKAVCSFPQDFKLMGSFADRWARLGNAVMPLQMKAVAETIRMEILDKS